MKKEDCEPCPYEQKGYCLEQEKKISEVEECKTLKRLQQTKHGLRKEAV